MIFGRHARSIWKRKRDSHGRKVANLNASSTRRAKFRDFDSHEKTYRIHIVKILAPLLWKQRTQRLSRGLAKIAVG